MTTPLPPQNPRTLDEALPGEIELAALYRQLPQNEPGPALDAAVLHAAAQALASAEESPTALRERRRSARERSDWVHPKEPLPSTPIASLPGAGGRKRPRWPIALGSAASVVLVAGLAWHMRGVPLPESAPSSTGNIAPVNVTAAVPDMATPPPAPPPRSPRQPPPRMIVAQQAPMPAAPALRRPAADKRAEQASAATRFTSGLAPAAPPTVSQVPINDSAAKTARPTMKKATAASVDIPAAMAAAPAPVAMAADTATTTPDASDTPAEELDKIRQLFAQGHDAEARQRLTAFRQAHPQWELPPELRAKLRKP